MKHPAEPRCFWFALVFAVASWTLGAEPAAKPTGIGVAVADIYETRSSGVLASECRINLTLTGDMVADAYGVRSVRVTKALDELGRDLVKPADSATAPTIHNYVNPSVPGATPAEEQQRLEAVAAEVARRRALRGETAEAIHLPTPLPAPSRPPAPSAPGSHQAFQPPILQRAMLSLRTPSRQSATIKLIEGEIVLFAPAEANGGIARLDGFADHAAEFLKHDALQAAGIRIMYLTPEAYETQLAKAGADAKDPASPWSDDFAAWFRGFVKQQSASRRPMALLFVDDPEHRLVDVELQTPEGRRLNRDTLQGASSLLRGLLLEAPLSPGARLVVRIANAGALATYPFKLENIPLP